jgi:hypothetical protein
MRQLLLLLSLPIARGRRWRRGTCTWRQWNTNNVTETKSQGYVLEQLLHEMLLQSPHRYTVRGLAMPLSWLHPQPPPCSAVYH